MNFVLDTNVVTYLLGGRLAEALPQGSYSISVISEMELLSYPGLAAAEEYAIRRLLDLVERHPLDNTVRDTAIALRRVHRRKLPDAIVGATAINWEAVLLGNDAAFAKVPELRVQTLSLA